MSVTQRQGRVVEDSPSKVGGLSLGSGETKVGDTYTLAITAAQDVFRLEIAMEDTKRMTVLDSINDLQEHLADQGIVANVLILSAGSLWQSRNKDSPSDAR